MMRFVAALNALQSHVIALLLVVVALGIFAVSCVCHQMAPQTAMLAAAGSIVGGALTLLVGEAKKNTATDAGAGPVQTVQQTQTPNVTS